MKPLTIVKALTLLAIISLFVGGRVGAESYYDWRARENYSYHTPQEVLGSLTMAGMPLWDALRLTYASVTCEAPVIDRDGRILGASMVFVGDHGRAFGPFQIRKDVWPDLFMVYDMSRLEGHAAAAVFIYEANNRTLNAWSCA